MKDTNKKYNVFAPYPEFYTKEKISLIDALKSKSYIEFAKEKHYKMKMGYPRKTRGSKRILLCDDKYVEQVLSNYKRYYKSKNLNAMLKPLLGESIFNSNGDTWRFQRNIMNKSFSALQPKRTFSLMLSSVEKLTDLIDKKILNSKNLTIDPLMTYVTANVIFKTIFSIDYSYSDSIKLYEDFNEYQKYSYLLSDSVYKYLFFLFFKHKQHQSVKKIHSQFYPIISKRFKEKDNNLAYNDILESLLNEVDEVSNNRFTQKDLNEQICMLFLAGHETSAVALTWTLYLISQCEELQQDLYEEIQASLDNNQIAYQSLKKMPLLLAVFEETMRLYPPVVALFRECRKPEIIRKEIIKPKDDIRIPLWLQHRHYDKWDNPMEFDPYRFYNKKANEKCPAYMPFGKGDRVCIGSAFAKQEALLILSHLIKRYKFKNLTEGVIPLSKITLKPNKQINIEFTLR